MLVLEGFAPGPDFADNIKFYLPYLFGFGFGYVALIHLLRFMLSLRGWIDDSESGAV